MKKNPSIYYPALAQSLGGNESRYPVGALEFESDRESFPQTVRAQAQLVASPRPRGLRLVADGRR